MSDLDFSAGKKPEELEETEIKPKSSPYMVYLKWVVVFVLVVLSGYGISSYFRLAPLMEHNKRLMEQVAGLEHKNSELASQIKDQKDSESLVKENKALKTALAAEIARKNKLAVRNTRLKGKVAQVRSDLALAIGSVCAYECPKDPKK